MAENFEEVLKKECHKKDLRTLTSQLSDHESLLRLKRRWLMDLPLSKKEQKRVNCLLSLNDKVLPESLIREDDVSYDDIKTHIETGFGACKRETEHDCAQVDLEVFNSRHFFNNTCSLLDDMTNKGLCSLTKALTGGTTKFAKTNCNMKRTIKESLPKVITASKNDNISKTKLKQVFHLLKDPNNFSEAYAACSTTTASEAYCEAAINVLDGLEDLPIKALFAMDRKIRGITNYVPSMIPRRYGRKRENLIKSVNNRCRKMLLSLDRRDEPPEYLAGALGVACLTLKLILNRTDVIDLRRFSPEIESLQKGIAKSIHLLNHQKRVSLIELKKLQLLVDPSSKLVDKTLRTNIRNLLIDYLYECSDMDKVPDSLVEIVNIINRKCPEKQSSLSSKELMHDAIQKEVEHVLNVSAQAKHVVSDFSTRNGFDEEFANAYMEDYEQSNAFFITDDDEHVRDFSDSYGYNSPPPGSLLCSSNGTILDSKVVDEQCTTRENFSDQGGFNSEETTICVLSDSQFEEPDIVGQQRNQYLEIQEACDATAMVAYRFMGQVLDKLAKREGLELSQGDRLYLRSHHEDSLDSPEALSTSKFSEMWKNVIEG